jgi:hypothetical protein
MIPISTRQIAAIHASAKNAGLDEEARRDVIESASGKRSARDLTSAEGYRVIEAIKGLSQGSREPTASTTSRRSPAKTMSGKYAGVLRALWLSGYNLGVVENRDDVALIAFVERQTKIAHPRFLLDPADAQVEVLNPDDSVLLAEHTPFSETLLSACEIALNASLRGY